MQGILGEPNSLTSLPNSLLLMHIYVYTYMLFIQLIMQIVVPLELTQLSRLPLLMIPHLVHQMVCVQTITHLYNHKFRSGSANAFPRTNICSWWITITGFNCVMYVS